ncbi:MAG: nucleotide pyrophosphohydrolase [Candidatus Altiarchaeota archaeon]|nr:nucleotide pyrophosphohydrolase [Candidatus Altiarchaeota archaeon]
MEKLQKKVANFTKKNKMEVAPEHRTLDLMSEVGEFAKEILNASNYGRKDTEYHDKLMDELGDVFYSLITVANSFDINLEKALNKSLKKYKERLGKKGSAASKKRK